jgi:hypothetical protein
MEKGKSGKIVFYRMLLKIDYAIKPDKEEPCIIIPDRKEPSTII